MGGCMLRKYVILADGEFPKGETALHHLKTADILVCCDGAVDKLCPKDEINSRVPDFIVGDMDSISSENRERFSDRIYKICEQESNDLSKAFHFILNLIEDEEFEIRILGATGRREDHTIGNISLLSKYALELKERFGEERPISIVTDNGEFVPIFDNCTIELKKGTPVSIFSQDSTLRLRSEGLEYPTDDVIFDEWWKASLNIASSEKIVLKFNHPAKVLLYLGYEV